MTINYQLNADISVEQFIDLLKESTLGERRPIEDKECLAGALKNSNLVVTAWDGKRLVGIARSVADFHYCCYLSDLAVSEKYQRMGIGKALLERTKAQLGEKCKLILLAAPKANEYYEQLGYSNNPRCWVLD